MLEIIIGSCPDESGSTIQVVVKMCVQQTYHICSQPYPSRKKKLINKVMLIMLVLLNYLKKYFFPFIIVQMIMQKIS